MQGVRVSTLTSGAFWCKGEASERGGGTMSVADGMTVELRQDQRERLTRLAESQGRSASEIVQEALDQFLAVPGEGAALAVWRAHLQRIKDRAAAIPGGDARRTWTREELYDQ